jgi:response regulator RpfG family c-di-GMP phosphodiesterase
LLILKREVIPRYSCHTSITINTGECLVKNIKYPGYTIYMKKRKVLIIDDEEDFGMLMKRFFSQKNYDVYVAYTISDGLKLLDEHLPDIIFLDNNLPDGYGWDKTDYILSTYPQTQLNLISALNVPKTSSSSFRILEKQMLLKELPKMFV